ncbi:MAG TPA: hypothetical protein VHS07_03160 [Candidatus Binataceae bacterium]|jgi:hypothetical protein|nr:hypothetical protein [Candidatus Binataceae bacterium]
MRSITTVAAAPPRRMAREVASSLCAAKLLDYHALDSMGGPRVFCSADAAGEALKGEVSLGIQGMGSTRMLFKIALSIGVMALWQLADDEITDNDRQQQLEEDVAAQLQSLREHLFKR